VDERPVHIYVLLDPLSGAIRYVGGTRKRLNLRLGDHLADVGRAPRVRWIQDLVSRGLRPDINLVETVESEDSSAAESFWILHYRSLGFDLLNTSDDGRGHSAPHESRPQHVRDQIGRSHRQLWESGDREDIRERLRQQNLGRKMSAESIEKMKLNQRRAYGKEG
jgi:hypothetical protein